MAQQNVVTELNAEAMRLILPRRDIAAHKGDCGSVAVIGGDDGMVGAALLAARAALLGGAGRVYAALLSHSAPSVDMMQPEIMLRKPFDLLQLTQLDALVIGPGLGQSIAAIEVLILWLKHAATQHLSLVLDADALNLIAQHAHLADLTRHCLVPPVMTPHAGEAARLLQISPGQFSPDEVQKNRTEITLQLADKYRCVCVLKGVGTLCADASGNCFMNTTGNPALATGGTGDVLAGLIASLIAQGVHVMDAAKLAVYAHGLAADQLVARGVGVRGLTASELLVEIRHVMNHL